MVDDGDEGEDWVLLWFMFVMGIEIEFDLEVLLFGMLQEFLKLLS